MTLPESPAEAVEAPNEAPPRWSTREMEMVISGAIIVALLQVPGYFTSVYQEFLPHLSSEWFMVPYMLYYAGMLILYPVILIFLLHFALRGFWVGLLGLRAVFPHGIRWDQLPNHPIERDFYQQRNTSLDPLLTRVDQACSLLFSLMFASIFGLATIYGGFALLTAILIALMPTIGPDINPLWLMVAAFTFVQTLLFGSRMGASLLAHRFKKDPDWPQNNPRAYALAIWLLKVSHYGSLGFLSAPIVLTHASNFKRSQVTMTYIGLMYMGLLCAVGTIIFSSGLISLSSNIWFPVEAAESGAYAGHYASRKSTEPSLFRRPTIQSDIIKDNYLRLVIPFDLRRDNDRLREHCPDLTPLRKEGLQLGYLSNNGDAEQRAATLDCVASIYTVTLDDQPIAAEFLFSRDAETDLPTLVTYLPCADLDEGRHLLTLHKKPTVEEQEEPRDHRPTTFYIPFWK